MDLLDASMMGAVRRGLYYAGKSRDANKLHRRWPRMSLKAKRHMYRLWSQVPVSEKTRFREQGR